MTELILATAGGDEAAFARLYQATSPRLLAQILRIVKRRAAAEEVLQEVYLKIWQQAETYRTDRGSPMAWLITIARNRALDLWRRERRNPAAPDGADLEAALAANDPGLDWAAAGEEGQALRRCLERLAGKSRQVILLAYLEGFTHEEMSRRLACPLGTVKSWLRRGLLRLRDCLQQ